MGCAEPYGFLERVRFYLGWLAMILIRNPWVEGTSVSPPLIKRLKVDVGTISQSSYSQLRMGPDYPGYCTISVACKTSDSNLVSCDRTFGNLIVLARSTVACEVLVVY
jgi:hypothetical protein